jgi:hypothetical protein
MFFLFLMIVHNNPFDTYLTRRTPTAAGLNPLLQNFYMAIHPPTMYLGFVGLTIPFAFGMAALITGHLDDSWLRAVRRWTMFSWFFLSLGLTLGMIWAYEELGWGGYWGWDPVENAGLLPWFTATAFLHSVMVQERRGMLRVWNVTLVILTFLLTIFGTFMTRSGIVQSVHAFGEDPALARLFTVFMIVMPRSASAGSSTGCRCCGAPRARLVGVARGGVPGQQLDPAVLGVLRPLRHDVPDHHRGHQRASGSRSGRRSSTSGCCRSGWCCCCSPASARCSPGASPRSRTCGSVPVSRRGSAWSVAGRWWRSACACGARASASRCAGSCSARSRRSSGAAPACGAARPAPISSPHGSASSAATSAATAATSCTSASC